MQQTVGRKARKREPLVPRVPTDPVVPPPRTRALRWDESEVEILKAALNSSETPNPHFWAELVRKLPARSKAGIKAKYYSLKSLSIAEETGGRTSSPPKAETEPSSTIGIDGIGIDGGNKEGRKSDGGQSLDEGKEGGLNSHEESAVGYESFSQLAWKIHRNQRNDSFQRERCYIPAKVPMYMLGYGQRWLAERRLTLKSEVWTWCTLNSAVYCVAKASSLILKQARYTKVALVLERGRCLEETIEALKSRISEMEAELQWRRAKVAPSRNQIRILRKHRKMHLNHSHQLLNKITELKVALSDRIRAKERSESDAERQNARLRPNKARERCDVSNLNKGEISRIWRKTLGEERTFRMIPEMKEWFREVKASCNSENVSTTKEMETDVEEVIKRTRPFKAPGPDGLQAFWLKNLPEAKMAVKSLIVTTLQGRAVFPTELVNGRTVLLPKCASPREKDFRPITLLNTMYKLLTGTIARMMQRAVSTHSVLFPSQQVAVCKGRQGCVEAHLIDQSIKLDRSRRKAPGNNLIEAWVDFAKAFDSISHEFLRALVKVLPLPLEVKTALKSLIRRWCVNLSLNNELLLNIRVKRGILQGDALSPLMFCLAVAPVSYWLNKGAGYRSYLYSDSRYIQATHSYYMDDLKLYTQSLEEMKGQLGKVSKIGKSIGILINPAKSAFKVVKSTEDCPERLAGVGRLVSDSGYRYLGVEQSGITSCQTLTERLFERISERTHEILQKAELLTAGQIISELNTRVFPIAQFIFTTAMFGKRAEEGAAYADRLDCALRKRLAAAKLRYERMEIASLYRNRKKGGLGLSTFRETLTRALINKYTYLMFSKQMEAYADIQLGQSKNKSQRRTLCNDFFAEMRTLNIECEVEPSVFLKIGGETITNLKSIRKTLLLVARARYEERWKPAREPVPKPWMEKLLVNCKVVRVITALTNQSLLKASNIPARSCPSCESAAESIFHVTSGCPKYLTNLYMYRHNQVARWIWNMIIEQCGGKPGHYSQEPPPVVVTETAEVWWDVPAQCSGRLYHRKPDIIVYRGKRESGFSEITIIEVAVAWKDAMVREKELKRNRYMVNGTRRDNETELPYEPGMNLCTELELKYHCTVRFVPVIVGALGEVEPTLSRELCEALRLSRKESNEVMEKLSRSAALGTYRVWMNHLGKVSQQSS